MQTANIYINQSIAHLFEELRNAQAQSEEFQSRVSELQKAFADLTAQKQQSDSKCFELEIQHKKLPETTQTFQVEKESLQKQLAHAQKTHQAQTTQLHQELSQARTNYNQLKQEFDLLSLEQKNFQVTIENNYQQISALESQLSKLSEEYQSCKDSLTAQINSLTEQLEASETLNKELQERLTSLEQEHKSRLEELKNEHSTALFEQETKYAKVINKLRVQCNTSFEDPEDRVSYLVEKLDNLQTKYLETKALLEEKQNQLRTFLTEYQKKLPVIQQQKTDYDRVYRKYRGLKETLKQKEQEISDLKLRPQPSPHEALEQKDLEINELKFLITTYQEQLSNSKDQIERFLSNSETRTQEKLKQLSELEAFYQNFKSESQKLHFENQNLTAKNQELSFEVQELQKSNQNNIKKITELEHQIQNSLQPQQPPQQPSGTLINKLKADLEIANKVVSSLKNNNTLLLKELQTVNQTYLNLQNQIKLNESHMTESQLHYRYQFKKFLEEKLEFYRLFMKSQKELTLAQEKHQNEVSSLQTELEDFKVQALRPTENELDFSIELDELRNKYKQLQENYQALEGKLFVTQTNDPCKQLQMNNEELMSVKQLLTEKEASISKLTLEKQVLENDCQKLMGKILSLENDYHYLQRQTQAIPPTLETSNQFSERIENLNPRLQDSQTLRRLVAIIHRLS